MIFDINKFRIRRQDDDMWEADLIPILEFYQQQYFTEEKSPAKRIEFVASLEGPARVIPQIGLIEVHERLRNFPKICCFVVLHEMINNKLFHEYGCPQPYDANTFQNELKRLWDAGAYKDIL